MAKDLFNRYLWLVDTIYRAGTITLDEINRKWLQCEMSNGEEIPNRTFHNHRKAIEELFDINIECDRHNGCNYYIENTEELKKEGLRKWLLNTFAVNTTLNKSHKLKDNFLSSFDTACTKSPPNPKNDRTLSQPPQRHLRPDKNQGTAPQTERKIRETAQESDRRASSPHLTTSRLRNT